MSDALLIVSLLADAAMGEVVLAETRTLLPPARRSSTLLLRAPDAATPAVGAVAQLPPGTVVLVDDGAAARQIATEAAQLRLVVWCRTDAACAAWDGSGAAAVVADTAGEVAWELVRSTIQASGVIAAAGGDGAELTPRPHPGPALVPPPILQVVDGVRREAAVPPAPSWATSQAVSIPGSPEVRGASMPRPASWASSRELEELPSPVVVPPVEQRTEDAPARIDAARPPSAGQVATPHRVEAAAADGRPLAALRAPDAAVEPDAPPASPVELPPPPFAALAAMLPPLADGGAPAAEPPPPRLHGRRVAPSAVRGPRLALPFLRRRPTFSAQAADDARRLAAWRSTVLGVWNIKGGTGKTTLAGTIGILSAQLVEPLGGRSLVIEGNPGNPDQGTFLGVPASATTVRDVMRALARGATVPEGEYARDARCRVLPEPRGNPSGYSAAEVRRFVAHVRGINTVVVVDLGNAAPSQAQGSREALVEHWMPHADVWVIPIDLGEASFVGAGECLDAIEEQASRLGRGLPGIVVPLLLPPGGRRATRVPEIAELLTHLREVGAEVVQVPYLIEINVAQHQRRTVVGRDPKVTRAFEPVLRAVVQARERDAKGGRA